MTVLDSLFLSNANRGAEIYMSNFYTLKLRGDVLPNTSAVHSGAQGDWSSMQLQQHKAVLTLQVLLPSKADLLKPNTVLWQWRTTSTAWARLTAAMQGELQGLAVDMPLDRVKEKWDQ